MKISFFLSLPRIALLPSPPYHFHKRFYCSHFSLLLHSYLLIKQLFFSSSFFFSFIPFRTRVICILDFTRTYPHCKNPFFTFPASYSICVPTTLFVFSSDTLTPNIRSHAKVRYFSFHLVIKQYIACL